MAKYNSLFSDEAEEVKEPEAASVQELPTEHVELPLRKWTSLFSDESQLVGADPPLSNGGQDKYSYEKREIVMHSDTGSAVGDALLEGAKGAGRAVKAFGGAFVGLGSGAVRLAGTPVRAVTGWDGLHRMADAIDKGYEDWGAEALKANDDGWMNHIGEKIAGTAGSLAAMAAGGGLAKLGAAGKFGAASNAVGKAGAALQKSLPFMFGNDAAVRTYDTAKENGSGTARALGLASVNGAIHYFGFKAFENQSLNKMLGMPQEMGAMMPKWADAAMAKNAAGNTFTSLASGVRNGMFKYILAERAKGALKAGGIMGLQNFLSSVPTQMAEGAGLADVDWGRAALEGAEGLGEGAFMEGLMGGAAALKTPKEARKFIADTYFRNGYRLPNGQHVPGLLHSEEGRSFIMKQNPEMQRRILDILDHGGKVTKGELNAACLPPDMTEAELREFAKDWRKDLASEWDRAAEPETLGEGEELEGNEPVIPREQQMRNRAKVNEMRDHEQRVAEAEEAERARAEEQAADDAAVAAEEAKWAGANAKADAERAEEAAGAEQLAREEAYPQPATEQAPAQELTEPPVAERSNRLRRNLKPNFRHQGENQQQQAQQQPQQEIPNETGNVPVEAQPKPPAQDAGRGGQQQAPQAAEGLAEAEPPRGEVAVAGKVAAEPSPVSKSDNGGQKVTGDAGTEKNSPNVTGKAAGTGKAVQEAAETGASLTGAQTEQKVETAPSASAEAKPPAEPPKNAPRSEGSAEGTTTPPQSADAPQGAESAAGGATGGAAEEPKPTKGNKLRRGGGKKGKKLEAQEPKADATPAPTTADATPAAAPKLKPGPKRKSQEQLKAAAVERNTDRVRKLIDTGKREDGSYDPDRFRRHGGNGGLELEQLTSLYESPDWHEKLGLDKAEAEKLRYALDEAYERQRAASPNRKDKANDTGEATHAVSASAALKKLENHPKSLKYLVDAHMKCVNAMEAAQRQGDKAGEEYFTKKVTELNGRIEALSSKDQAKIPEIQRDITSKLNQEEQKNRVSLNDSENRDIEIADTADVRSGSKSAEDLHKGLKALDEARADDATPDKIDEGQQLAEAFLSKMGVGGDKSAGLTAKVDGDKITFTWSGHKNRRGESETLTVTRKLDEVLDAMWPKDAKGNKKKNLSKSEREEIEWAKSVVADLKGGGSRDVRESRGANAESPADRDAKFAADADYQRWLKARKANDAEPLRQRYEMEQAKALGDVFENAVRGVDVEYVGDRDYDPAIDGGGDGRKSIGGVFTGGPNDYASRSRRGGVDDGPSLHKIGSGEGTNVYGWGLYGSNQKGVADFYAKAGVENRKSEIEVFPYDVKLKGGERNATDLPPIEDNALGFVRKYGSVEKAVSEIDARIKGFNEKYADDEYWRDRMSNPLVAARDWLRKNADRIDVSKAAGTHGYVYEQTFFTDRAPGDESHLLKWYESVTREQMDWIESRLKAEGIGNVNMPFLKGELPNPDNPSGGPANSKIKNGRTVYDHLANKLGSPQAASEFLARAGIDGVKYPVDSYGGKGVKDGNKVGWNYVSFRDDNIRVDHKWEDGNLRYLRERGTGRVLGIFDRDTGKLKLFRGANWKTLNHELGGHATMRFAEQEAERGNRALLDKINESIDSAPQWLKDEVRRRYPDADRATLRDEIWAALRERPSEAMQKYVKTLQGRRWYNRAWDAIKTAWRGILSRMGFNRADLSGIDKMTPDEFNEFLDNAMIGGKTLGRIETQGNSIRMARGPAAPTAPSDKDVELYLNDKEGFLENIRRKFQDKNIVIRKIEEMLGITKKEESAYYAKDAAYGKNEHELTYLQKQEVEPIVEMIHKSGGSLELFSKYLYAKHAGERNRVLAKREGKVDGSGMSAAEAGQIIAAVDLLGLTKAFDAAADKVYEMNRKYLWRRVEAGRMTRDEYDFLTGQYQHYVPLRNDMTNEELEIFNSSTGGWKRNELRTAKGRREKADDPFAFSIVQSEEAIRASNANEARRKFANVVRRAAAKGIDIGEVVDGENKGGATWSFVFKDGKAISTESPMRLASERDDIILFKENGKLKAIKINPGANGRGLDLARAVTDKDVARFNKHLEWIPRATRIMSAMRTQYVPTFIIRNMKADNLEVLLNALSERGLRGENGKSGGVAFFGKFLKNEVSVAKGVKEYFKTGKSSDPFVDEAVKNGLLTGGGMAAEGFSETTRRLSDTLAALRGGKKGAVGRAFGAAKDLISLLNSCAEYNTRMGVYKTLREEGMSVADAVSYARDVTVNFNRKGYLTPYTNAAFMFSNASIQGMGRAFKSIKSEHGKGVIAGLFLVGAAQALLDDWLGHDDNDKSGGADSRNLTEYDKSHSLGVALPTGHRVKTGIRNPWALPVYMGRKTVELIKGLTSGEDAMKDIANAVGEFATEPVGGNGFGSVSEFLQTLAPTIIDPFVQWGTGKDYRGHDRVKKSFNQYEPDSWNGRDSTPEAYKAIAKALNFASGGGEHRKGAFDTSPENWKLLTETVFGGVLTDLNNVISAGEHAVKAVRGQPASQIVRDVPFVRDTFTNMPDSTTRYYEAVDAYSADKNEFKKTTELGRRAEMKKAHPYLTAQKGRVDTLIDQVKELTHRERGDVKVGQKWVRAKVEPSEERKEAFRKRRLRLQAEVLRILGK